MVWKYLKQIRKKNKMTLMQLADKVWYWAWNLSNYENDKLKAKDPTLIRILTKWYWMSRFDSKKLIWKWKAREIRDNYRVWLKIEQETDSYNEGYSWVIEKTIEEILADEWLDDECIEKIINDIDFYKKKTKKRKN